MSECPYCENSFEMTETCSDEFRMWQGLQGPYYVPSVDENGILSWTNTGELPNPDPVNIVGPDGQPFYIAGTVATVADLPATGDGAWLVGSAAPYEAYTQINGVWTDIGVLTVGPAGQDGVGVPAGGSTNYVLAKRSNTDYDTEWQPAGGVAPYTSNPEMDGTASAGDSANFSRGNHVHPSDTSRLAIDGTSVSLWGSSQRNLNNLITGAALCNEYVQNVPTADWWLVISAGDDNGTRTQVAYSLWNTSLPMTRYCASNTWSAWSAIPAVNKTGDTMTGALTVRATNIPAGTPETDTYTRVFVGEDAAGNDMGYFQLGSTTSGVKGLTFEAEREINGSSVYNGVHLSIDANGGCGVYLSQLAAWKSALGIGGTSADTTLSNFVTAGTNITISDGGFYQWGKVVQLRLVLTSSAAMSGNTTVAILKSGYRPIISAGLSSTHANFHHGYASNNGNVVVNGSIAANSSITLYSTFILP